MHTDTSTTPTPTSDTAQAKAAQQYSTADALSKKSVKLLGVGCSLMGLGVLIPLLIVCGVVLWAVASGLLYGGGKSSSIKAEKPPSKLAKAIPKTHSTSPQFLVKKGTLTYADEKALAGVLESENKLNKMLAAPETEGDDNALDAHSAFRRKLEREGRAVELNKDCLVTLCAGVQHPGYREAVTAEGNHFWVAGEAILSQDTPDGSLAVTGEMVFKGDAWATVDRAEVQTLRDLVGGLYHGTISAATARKCVFTPDAQDGAAIKVLDGVTIYQVRLPAPHGMAEFALKNNGGNDDPILSGSVRFLEMAQFTTTGGFVKQVPLFGIEKSDQFKKTDSR